MSNNKYTAYNSVTITSNADNPKVKKGFSFYQKLFFLYFLNLIDWICTEVLLMTGKFFEANPIMQPILENFWTTVLIKGILPLALIILCCIIYKISGEIDSPVTNILINVGIVAYALLNAWHILNFVLLFSVF